jgi:hypothetical protein
MHQCLAILHQLIRTGYRRKKTLLPPDILVSCQGSQHRKGSHVHIKNRYRAGNESIPPVSGILIFGVLSTIGGVYFAFFSLQEFPVRLPLLYNFPQ